MLHAVGPDEVCRYVARENKVNLVDEEQAKEALVPREMEIQGVPSMARPLSIKGSYM